MIQLFDHKVRIRDQVEILEIRRSEIPQAHYRRLLTTKDFLNIAVQKVLKSSLVGSAAIAAAFSASTASIAFNPVLLKKTALK